MKQPWFGLSVGPFQLGWWAGVIHPTALSVKKHRHLGASPRSSMGQCISIYLHWGHVEGKCCWAFMYKYVLIEIHIWYISAFRGARYLKAFRKSIHHTAVAKSQRCVGKSERDSEKLGKLSFWNPNTPATGFRVVNWHANLYKYNRNNINRPLYEYVLSMYVSHVYLYVWVCIVNACISCTSACMYLHITLYNYIYIWACQQS